MTDGLIEKQRRWSLLTSVHHAGAYKPMANNNYCVIIIIVAGWWHHGNGLDHQSRLIIDMEIVMKAFNAIHFGLHWKRPEEKEPNVTDPWRRGRDRPIKTGDFHHFFLYIYIYL